MVFWGWGAKRNDSGGALRDLKLRSFKTKVREYLMGLWD
jgi:hypothetical protein